MTDPTAAFLTNIIDSPNAAIDFRLIHDTDKGAQGINLRGTLTDLAQTLQQYNLSGYGVFYNINAMDGRGHSLENVHSIRAHVVDLDDTLTSQDGYDRACASAMPPHMAVQSSPGKIHLYWLVVPYTGNDFYSEQQRKLAQLYSGDPSITDATRVMRVPGFYHLKNPDRPHLVTCWQVSDHPRYKPEQILQHLQHVNVVQHTGSRHPLGDPSKAAPSLEWLIFALSLKNPNDMIRDDWVSFTSAFKQAGWTLADEQTLLNIWLGWCAQYADNDLGENMKLWNSLRETETGWGHFERVTMVKAYINAAATPPDLQSVRDAAAQIPPPNPTEPPPVLPDILDAHGKRIWFKDCYFIAREGKIFSPTGRFMNSTQFNGLYGGKEFSVKEAGGKVTDEPWNAALRARDWQIPKVDHVRFLPDEPSFMIIRDRLGRAGLNTYMPVIYDAAPGDVTPFTNHVANILPDPNDQRIFLSYIAHIIKYPGFKIPWAVLLQSVEGVGKTVFFEVLQYALGEMYVYRPKAQELIASGSKFNAWMRNRLAIVVDEIKVDERRELVEVLKPMITDKQIEIQAKGVDQEMEDNAANWLFFSNFRDAIPITQNGRRYCIFYSSLQTVRDKLNAGMDDPYFKNLFDWLRADGLRHITHWFLNYPIERGSLSTTAPETSSHAEALRIGRSPLEVLIDDRVAAGERGFHNGYISWPMLMKAIEQSSMRSKPPEHVICSVLDMKGYHELGYTNGPIGGEDLMAPSLLFGLSPDMRVEGY